MLVMEFIYGFIRQCIKNLFEGIQIRAPNSLLPVTVNFSNYTHCVSIFIFKTLLIVLSVLFCPLCYKYRLACQQWEPAILCNMFSFLLDFINRECAIKLMKRRVLNYWRSSLLLSTSLSLHQCTRHSW